MFGPKGAFFLINVLEKRIFIINTGGGTGGGVLQEGRLSNQLWAVLAPGNKLVYLYVCKFSMFIHTCVALEGTLSIVCLVCVKEAIRDLFSGPLGKRDSMAYISVV